MSKAEELLDSIDDVKVMMALASQSTENHIIVGDDRYITVPEELKRLAVQYDHNVETVTFDCPRYWDGLDMSEMTVYINYLRADGEPGAYRADNITTDSKYSSIMHFDWTISRNVTEVNGNLVFLICIRKSDEDGNEKNHWNSELCKDCYVSQGLEFDGEALKELYPDIVEQWHREVLEVVDVVENVTKNLIEMRDSGELDGATFTPMLSEDGDLSWTNDKGRENPKTVNIRGATYTPTVSEDGNISWTNDKGNPNPEPVNIRGNDGVSPTIQVTDIQGGHRITITDINGTRSVDIMDTIIDANDAVVKMLNDFVYISDAEPSAGPVLWFDTSCTPAPTTEETTLELEDEVSTASVMASVDGVDYSISNMSDPVATDEEDTYELFIN